MKLTNRMEQYIIGFLLGDGYAEKHPVNCRLGFHHSQSQLAYLRWKHELLTPWSGKLTLYDDLDKKTGKIYKKCRFCTYTRPEFNIYRQLFYPQGEKIIPDNIGEFLTERGLVAWYMDHGSYRKDRTTFRISTHCFSRVSLQFLQTVLRNNFSLSTTLSSSRPKKKGKRTVGDDKDWIINIEKSSCQHFHSIIAPLISQELPLFQYKLLEPRND